MLWIALAVASKGYSFCLKDIGLEKSAKSSDSNDFLLYIISLL